MDCFVLSVIVASEWGMNECTRSFFFDLSANIRDNEAARAYVEAGE